MRISAKMNFWHYLVIFETLHFPFKAFHLKLSFFYINYRTPVYNGLTGIVIGITLNFCFDLDRMNAFTLLNLPVSFSPFFLVE